MLLVRFAALASALLLGACAATPPPDRYEKIALASTGVPVIAPAWSEVITVSTIARIQWIDLEWEHSEQALGYWRMRKGPPVDIVVTLKDGKSSRHTVKTGAYVSVARDELRLP